MRCNAPHPFKPEWFDLHGGNETFAVSHDEI
jgi:hypothetical protein